MRHTWCHGLGTIWTRRCSHVRQKVVCANWLYLAVDNDPGNRVSSSRRGVKYAVGIFLCPPGGVKSNWKSRFTVDISNRPGYISTAVWRPPLHVGGQTWCHGHRVPGRTHPESVRWTANPVPLTDFGRGNATCHQPAPPTPSDRIPPPTGRLGWALIIYCLT